MQEVKNFPGGKTPGPPAAASNAAGEGAYNAGEGEERRGRGRERGKGEKGEGRGERGRGKGGGEGRKGQGERGRGGGRVDLNNFCLTKYFVLATGLLVYSGRVRVGSFVCGSFSSVVLDSLVHTNKYTFSYLTIWLMLFQ